MDFLSCADGGEFDPDETRLLYRNAVEKVWPAVVKIVALPHDGVGGWQGTGFLIRPYGIVLTAAHVVPRQHHLRVTLSDGRSLWATRSEGEAETDVGAVIIPAFGTPFVSLGESQSVQIGQPVVALSTFNAPDFRQIMAAGKVRRLERLPDGRVESIWTSVPVIRGCSGSPLVNLNGEAVGIVNRVDTSGHGIAVPVNTAKSFAKERLGEDPQPPKMGVGLIKGWAPERTGAAPDEVQPPPTSQGWLDVDDEEDNLGADAYVFIDELVRQGDE